MSTLAVVEEILRETGVPMSVRQIVEYSAGRLPTRSRTPDTVVARDLSMDIKRLGATSRFARVAPGRYALRGAAAHPGAPVSPDSERAGEEAATAVLSAAMRGERAGALPAATADGGKSSAPVKSGSAAAGKPASKSVSATSV
jgi:HB1, ASXL, restriction endonuclease HTH domain